MLKFREERQELWDYAASAVQHRPLSSSKHKVRQWPGVKCQVYCEMEKKQNGPNIGKLWKNPQKCEHTINNTEKNAQWQEG